MSQSWPEVELGDVLQKVVGGGTPSRGNSAFWEGDIPWATVKDMKDGEFKLSDTKEFITELGLAKSASNLIPAGTVITSTRMGLGRCFIASCPVAINQDLKALFPTRAINSRYLLWLMVSRAGEIQGMGTGTTVSGIRLEQLRSIRFPLPPLPTQRKIAAILSAYDDLIENNTRRVQVLEQMARALYREWFVEYRFPGHEQAEWVEDEQGRRPAGWEQKKLGDIAVELRRSVEPSEIAPDTRYVGLEHIPRRKIALDDWGTAADVQSTKLRFDAGDVLFGKIRPYFHKVSVASMSGVCSTDAIVINALKPELRPLMVMTVASDEFVEHSVQTSNGTKMPRANWKVLTQYPVVIPPLELLEKFNAIVEDVIQQGANLTQRNANLRQTRDLLLPRLVSGELDVSGLRVAGPGLEGEEQV